jgi:hypothetical protein
MREHSVNELNNFIMGWYIDPGICDRLIDIHKHSRNKKPGAAGIANAQVAIDKTVKDSIDVCLSPNIVPKEYSNVLFKCLDLYTNKHEFSKINEVILYEDSQIQYYPPGGGYKNWHMEKSGLAWPLVTRHMVFMTYLNTVEDQGGTDFYYQGITTKAEKGLTLLWPPEWPWTHRSQVSPTEEKYIITGWLNMKTYPLKGNNNA